MRDHQRQALLDGWHLLHDACAAGITIETILISAPPPTPADARLLETLGQHAAVLAVSTSVMNAASPVQTPAGVVALAQRRSSTLAELLTPAPAMVVVASDIQDPGNAGAIVRSAEAGGATGVVMAGASADVWSWKALRAGMGSTFRLPVLQEADALEAVASLSRNGLRLLATIPRGGSTMQSTDLRQPIALLVGGEGAGLPQELLAVADATVSIPMQGHVESLNVAVATAVLVYEALRQRAST